MGNQRCLNCLYCELPNVTCNNIEARNDIAISLAPDTIACEYWEEREDEYSNAVQIV